MKIEVVGEMKARDITTKQGRALTFREQKAYAHLPGNKYPQPVTIQIPRDMAQGYPEGDYELASTSFFIDRYGKLALSPRLQPAGK